MTLALVAIASAILGFALGWYAFAGKGSTSELEQSNRFLDAIVENIPDMIFVKDAEQLRFVRFNRAGEELLGQSRESLYGKNDHDFFPAEEADFFTAKDREVLETGVLKNIRQEPIDTPNGVRWLHTKKVPIMGVDGRPEYLLGISEDITDRLALEAERRRLIELLEETPDFVGLADTDGKVTYLNRMARKIVGLEDWNSSAGGFHLTEFHPEAVHEQLMKEVLPTAAEVGLWRGELPLIRSDGTLCPTIAIIQSHRTRSGEPTHYSIQAHDIEQRKRAEAELERRAAALEISNRELQQFAYVASHDLQEPLRNVAVYCELLEDTYGDQLEPRAKRWIGYASEGSKRLATLIDELLAYSRLDNSPTPFRCVDTHELVSLVIAALDQAIKTAGATVRIEGELPRTRADKTQLRQVFQNLISNGIKFARDGVPPEVVISADRIDERWLFKVSDNGIGIAPEHQDGVFGIFRRLVPRSRFPGTGIGLAIVKRVVERHSGSVTLESTLGEGSTFLFTVRGMTETG